jgi:anthranilate phosphoribosyltransferase
MTHKNGSFQALSTLPHLSEDQMEQAITMIMDGDVEEVNIASFLTTLAKRGETIDEITGAAKALRQKVRAFTPAPHAIDCCGTGGDGVGTYNISTAVAFVCASYGIAMAKHGNRAASSKSGAADVLEALGVNINAFAEVQNSALTEIGFCFLMAPLYHDAMRHVASVRKSLGFKTIFNLLGPLSNPAGTKRQLIGVFDSKWLTPMAQTLDRLGTTDAWLVHGHDGLDEITQTDKTDLVILKNGAITKHVLSPASFGLPECKAEDLKGGDAQHNAIALLDLLNGTKSAYRDIVVANSAAIMALHDGKDPDTLAHYARIAESLIDSGKALDILNRTKEKLGSL